MEPEIKSRMFLFPKDNRRSEVAASEEHGDARERYEINRLFLKTAFGITRN